MDLARSENEVSTADSWIDRGEVGSAEGEARGEASSYRKRAKESDASQREMRS